MRISDWSSDVCSSDLFERGSVIILGRAQSESSPAQEDIVVTGSRISGAPSAAPVIRVTSEDIRNGGQADLGEVARSLPQNFRSEEHTSELQSLMRISYAVFCLKKKNKKQPKQKFRN